ncbi:MAG: serine/threonine protein kinase, partial [Deltaproteobacteria bacterium]|nr:serine/threonine protein kinase [Deltaproteobacteria bacterium]
MTDTTELIGRVFDKRYQITELIGRGGMGAVYKAVHVAMNQIVALKVLGRSLAGDEKQIQRFYQEARSSSRLKHPNTIKVFDFGRSEDGHLFLAMEYLEGHTLSHIIRQEKVLPVKRSLVIGRQVLKSLGEAHKTGLIHRDLKPDNIFITEIYGEKDYVKVLDFGIAKFFETGQAHESLTQTGLICGTPLYLSPEQALGRPLDGRSDLYSFGVILYEMIGGQPPFRAETPIALVMRHIHDKPPLLNEFNRELVVPDKLNGLIFSLLEKEKTKRPADAEEVIGLIDGILADGNFPEVPSKNYLPNYPAAQPHTKMERVPSQRVGSIPSNEIQTVFLPPESDGIVLPDHEAPTTFMSQEKINKIPPAPWRNHAIEASQATAVKTLAESGTRIP